MLWYDMRNYTTECEAMHIARPSTPEDRLAMARVWQALWDCQDLGVPPDGWSAYILSQASKWGYLWHDVYNDRQSIAKICEAFSRWLDALCAGLPGYGKSH